MALFYLETSALVKLYVREPGTEQMLELAKGSARNQLVVPALSRIEVRSAVRRREKNGEIPATIANHLMDAFDRHWRVRFTIQPVTETVLDAAGTLVDRYSLRAFDAVQLAGRVALKDSSRGDVPFFACADQVLLSAAKQEGISVYDPSS